MFSNIIKLYGTIIERVKFKLSVRKTLHTNSYPENKWDNVKCPSKVRRLQYYTDEITIKNESGLAQKIKQTVNNLAYKWHYFRYLYHKKYVSNKLLLLTSLKVASYNHIFL